MLMTPKKNLNACENGIPCPVKTGRQFLAATIDFTKFQSIIDMLKDNAPYQLQLTLHDKKSGDNMSGKCSDASHNYIR
ncbi:hypothetical protein NECAME_16770 [Necator americanus]|uniref:MD-2-related lipid-recognition domain-containing protein n=1 Tax=Necator americanus TaxID=51031 RepID=W2TTL4_NECAM|nr:hypothetical protein NECAME_16770 [Necator americanus]ETN85410.1 hypothetical protein NECAME_16770 [Necator americanus]